MEIRQIRAFLAVAELRHFGRAAEQLNVVQPAVSQQIRRLEQELGIPLFHRTTRSVELTSVGTVFQVHAREIMDAVARARRVGDLRTSTVRIGTGSGLGDLTSQVLGELSHREPGLSVELVRLPQEQRLRQLAAGDLAAAIIRGASEALPTGIESSPVLSECLFAAVPAARTNSRRSTVRLRDLTDMPVRLPTRRDSPALADALAKAYGQLGASVERIDSGADEDMLALIGIGPPSWTVFYPHKARLLERQAPPGVALRRIVAPRIVVTTFLATRANNPPARAFVDAFRAVAQFESGGSARVRRTDAR